MTFMTYIQQQEFRSLRFFIGCGGAVCCGAVCGGGARWC
jgi:hypothetical protein